MGKLGKNFEAVMDKIKDQLSGDWEADFTKILEEDFRRRKN